MKFTTVSDMGSIKLFNKGMSCFFLNGYGDGENTVTVKTKLLKNRKEDGEFLGHFTVKGVDNVYLSAYDCADDAIYCFPVGRWFVYLKKEGDFIISKCDEDTHA